MNDDTKVTSSCGKVFTDKCSGKDTNRPGLKAMLEFVRSGDTIIVHILL